MNKTQKQPTLLEIAKSKLHYKKLPFEITEEGKELAIAWVKDEISLRQVSAALNTKFKGNSHGGTTYAFLANVLKEHLNQK